MKRSTRKVHGLHTKDKSKTVVDYMCIALMSDTFTHVSGVVEFPRERRAANTANERFVVDMSVAEVTDEVIGGEEAVTNSAEKVVTPVTFVRARVLNKMVRTFVRLRASDALVQAAVRVRVHVLHDVALLLEALPADRARVAALVRVHKHVFGDAFLVCK